ncbi:uncharacterized protein B0P05DRAFT_527343, partial [Gilbertella persicaria]|uniref:uncharacterized protein n=1 Tax=Gilbertella persicaria TaxID=101096 RepID=UPI0022209BC3
MSLLLNDIHLPLLIKSTLSEHNILPWNNLDQLSSLWAVFTKYKNNMRDGFRLENLSWRLWYRQSVLQKKEKPKTSGDMNYSTMLVRPLRRTRSLPILSQWHQNVLQKKTTKLVPSKQPLPSELPQQRKKQKFFITEETQEPKKEDQLLFKKANSL